MHAAVSSLYLLRDLYVLGGDLSFFTQHRVTQRKHIIIFDVLENDNLQVNSMAGRYGILIFTLL
jgi:hypothetical protein